MKYLCLAYYDPAKFEAMPEAELRAIVSQCQSHDAALRSSGHLMAVASLQSPTSSTTVRPRNGQVSVTDGPFIETKEQVGAFFIIEAENAKQAIQVASMHPGAQLGEELGWGIEVRPIDVFEQP